MGWERKSHVLNCQNAPCLLEVLCLLVIAFELLLEEIPAVLTDSSPKHTWEVIFEADRPEASSPSHFEGQEGVALIYLLLEQRWEPPEWRLPPALTGQDLCGLGAATAWGAAASPLCPRLPGGKRECPGTPCLERGEPCPYRSSLKPQGPGWWPGTIKLP